MIGKYSIAFRKSLKSVSEGYETPEESIDEYTNKIAARRAVESASNIAIGSDIPVVEEDPRSDYWRQVRRELFQSYSNS